MEQHYTSDKSSDASVNKNRVALTLDQRRRAALEEVDNASFSLVLTESALMVYCANNLLLQLVPRQGRPCRRCWLLH